MYIIARNYILFIFLCNFVFIKRMFTRCEYFRNKQVIASTYSKYERQALFRIRKNNACKLCRSGAVVSIHRRSFLCKASDLCGWRKWNRCSLLHLQGRHLCTHQISGSKWISGNIIMLQGKIESFVGTGSGWRVEQVKQVSISFAIYDPMGVSIIHSITGFYNQTRGLC